MLKSLWRRLAPSGPGAPDERALARYFRDEGLHADLASHEARDTGSLSGYERIPRSVDLYFAL